MQINTKCGLHVPFCPILDIMCTKTDLSFRSPLGYTKNGLKFSYANCIPRTNVLGGGGGGVLWFSRISHICRHFIVLMITGFYFFPLLYICLLCDEVLLPWNFNSPGFDISPPPPRTPKYEKKCFFSSYFGLKLLIRLFPYLTCTYR